MTVEKEEEMDLKPCPFCGGNAELRHTEGNSEYGKTAFVACLRCGANSRMVSLSFKYSADEKAIEAWNRRASDG